MKKSKTVHGAKRNAFALVLAIAAMAFMVLLVLTLSSVITSKLRLLNAQKEHRQARANALLGMGVAISQLQRTMGPDNAISFSATIFDEDVDSPKIDGVLSPYIFGGYKMPLNKTDKSYKDYQDEMLEIFASLKERRSSSTDVNWFVSSEKPFSNPVLQNIRDFSDESIKIATYKALTNYPNSFGGEISSEQKADTVDVYAGKVKVESGYYAWWVSDESVKAKLNLHRPEKYLDNQSTGDATNFEGPSDTKIPQISNVSFVAELSENRLNPFLSGYNEETTLQFAKMSSMDEFAILDGTLGKWAKENKGDYTMYSYGLPVDVTQGRLKEDLTVYLETGNGVRDTDPIIRGHSNDDDYMGPNFGLSATAYDSNLPRMGFLKDYATIARQESKSKKADFTHAVKPSPRSEKHDSTGAKHGLYPIIHTVVYGFQPAYSGGQPGGQIKIYLMFYPRILMWNPHNVRLEASDYVVRLYMPYFLELGARGEKLGASPAEGNVPTNGHEGETCALMAVWPARVFTDAGSTVDKPKNIYYMPQMLYTESGGEGTLRRDFSEFLGKSLKRGKSPVAEGKGNVYGYPVINMKIEKLAFNPGETIELTAKNQAGTTYDEKSKSDSGVLLSSAYPLLSAGPMASSDGKINARAGIRLDPGITLAARHSNLLSGKIGAQYRANISEASGRIIGNWRVAPVLEATLMKETPTSKHGSFPCPGYELWLDGNNGLEMLMSFDMGKLEDNSKTVIDDYTGWNNTSNVKTGDPKYNSFWGQHEIFPAMYGVRFSNTFAWDNLLPTNTVGGRNSWHSRIGNVQTESGEFLDSDFTSTPTQGKDDKGNPTVKGFKMFNLTRSGSAYSLIEFNGHINNVYFAGDSSKKWGVISRPEIPEIETLINSPFEGSKVYKLLPETNNAEGYQDKIGTNTKFGYKVWEIADNENMAIFPKYHPFPNGLIWSIATVIPPKTDSVNGFTQSNTKEPALLSLTNFLRDNGNASRVNANHGYMAPVQDGGSGHGYNYLHKLIYLPNGDGALCTGDIGQKSANSGGVGSWEYLSYYASGTSDSHPDRQGFSPFWKGRPDHMPNKDAGLVQTIFDYPRFEEDLISLGIFHHANLSMMYWQPTFAFGESYASPFIPREQIINNEKKVLHDNELIDISFMLNASMWDRLYLSTIPQKSSVKPFAGMRLVNTRHIISSMPADNSALFGDEEAYKKSAAHVWVDGAFNVNSTSYEAWRALLTGMLGVKKESLLEGEYPVSSVEDSPDDFLMPNPGNLHPLLVPQKVEAKYGYRDAGTGRDISEADLDELTREIVAEVKRRAPFFSLGDFVNRRLISYRESVSDEDKAYQGLMGTIAAAIHRVAEEHTGSRANAFNMYQDRITVSNVEGVRYAVVDNTEEYIEHAKLGPMKNMYMHLRGLPGVLKQSQILNAIAPLLTVRGDTYTIRAFGEYKNEMTGTNTKAYCEAVVQRSSEPVDPSDDIVAPVGDFGRKFKVVSFRWLTPAEL